MMYKSSLIQHYQQSFSANLINSVKLIVSVLNNNYVNITHIFFPAGVSGHIYRNVSAGRHRIQLTARLRSDQSIKKTLKLERFTIQPPATTSPPPPPPPRVTPSAEVFDSCNVRLRFSADAAATFRCRANEGPWKTCELN